MHDDPLLQLSCRSGARPELASTQDFGGFGGRAGAAVSRSMLNLRGDDRLGILFGGWSSGNSWIVTDERFSEAAAFA